MEETTSRRCRGRRSRRAAAPMPGVAHPVQRIKTAAKTTGCRGRAPPDAARAIRERRFAEGRAHPTDRHLDSMCLARGRSMRLVVNTIQTTREAQHASRPSLVVVRDPTFIGDRLADALAGYE